MNSRRASRVLWLLLFAWIGINLACYLDGAAALREKWFHAERHAGWPFNIDKDLRLSSLKQDAKDAGIKERDILQTINGDEFIGDAQMSNDMARARPGEVMMGVS